MLDFLGTFNRSQFERLVAFAREHTHEVAARIQHLEAEATRIGAIGMVYDAAGNPTAYKVYPPESYLGRLVAAYEVMGGDVFYDLQIRAKAAPVFLRSGTETESANLFSNGEPVPEKALADAPSAKLVGNIRGWMSGVLERRDRLERKIRRAVDYADQLSDEIIILDKAVSLKEDPGSLEHAVSEINVLIADKNYRAIADDKGRDPHGKFTRAPLSAYEPGPGRKGSATGIERGADGYLVYGKGTT